MKKFNKVLLIDDSQAVNRINKVLLSELNVFNEIIDFTDAKEAFDYIDETSDRDDEDLPDIIFLDLVMPEMDGFAFLDEYIELESIIKSDFKPLIVIVSDHLEFNNFDKTKRYKSYGVVEHLRKPIDTEDIEELLEDHFKN